MVWLVREGDPIATEGTLSIEGPNLTFAPAGNEAGKVAIPIASMRRVRRRRGTPILALSYPEPNGMAKLFLYFAKPPPLPEDPTPSPVPLFRRPRGLERSAAALALRATHRLLKREIDTWVRALRDAGAGR